MRAHEDDRRRARSQGLKLRCVVRSTARRAPPQPVLDEATQRGSRRAGDVDQVRPGQADHALRTRPAGEDHRLSGGGESPRERRRIGSRHSLQPSWRGRRPVDQDDVAQLERLEQLVVREQGRGPCGPPLGRAGRSSGGFELYLGGVCPGFKCASPRSLTATPGTLEAPLTPGVSFPAKKPDSNAIAPAAIASETSTITTHSTAERALVIRLR